MEHSDQLTVLLMLKDRAAFTWRWFDYANETRFPFKILVADGGKDPSVEPVLSNRSAYPNLNYEYIRYPYDAAFHDYQVKAHDALSRVDTPYTAMVCNDDFYCAGVMNESVRFLAENLDYSATRGSVHRFGMRSRGVHRAHKKISGQFLWRGDQYPLSTDIVGDTAVERLRQAFDVPQCARMFEVIHRTPNIKRIYGVLAENKLADFRFELFLMAYMTIAFGKIRYTPEPTMLIQWDTPEGAGLEMISWHATEAHWICADNWPEMHNDFLNVMADTLANCDGISPDRARSFVASAFLDGQIRESISDLLAKAQSQSPPSILSKFEKWVAKKRNKIAARFEKPIDYAAVFPQEGASQFVQSVADYLQKVPQSLEIHESDSSPSAKAA